MAFFSQLSVMLWKNWILQRRRICVTIFEVILPLLFAALLLLIRSSIDTKPVDKPTLYEPKSLTHSTLLYSMSSYKTIVYAPHGRELDNLMSFVCQEYEQAATAEFNATLEARGFANEDDMEDYVEKHEHSVLMGFSFLNLEEGAAKNSLPKDLQFTMRPISYGSLWKTKRAYPFQTDNAPEGYDLYRSFLIPSSQRIMGDSLIKYWLSKTGGDPDSLSHGVWSQRMAYPPYIIDPMIIVVQQSLAPFLVYSLLISVIINTKNLVFEKERKLKESMKLMGLSSSVHWVSWFITFCIYLAPILFLYAIFLGVPFFEDKGAVLQHSDTSLIFVFLLVYGLATISFCFMVASFVQKANIAAVLSGILFFATYCPQTYIVNNYEYLSKSQKLSFCLLANCGLIFGANVLGRYEGTGEGVKWSNFSQPATPDDNVSLLDCMLMLLLDSVIYLIIFWYMDNVRPGEFGLPKPYHFCFMKSYWFGSSNKQDKRIPTTRAMSDGDLRLRFENEPANLQAGIQINGFSKVFGKKTAVDNLSLNMYEGQITVLLGHNGAGKTTTMSMLTGFIPPSSGSAIVNGYDINKNLAGVRSSLGLCPQHNILFDTLTVSEHLMFFARLKGATSQQANSEIEPLLKEVGLLDKRFSLSTTLSGGQKRKLSVAIALIAGSKIVILDEPSSGMDPGARRQTWSVLQNHREGRTILLTTHYMDEADVLGDRIAIMAEGVVKCCGTSMFLKKLYGAGYHLVVVKTPSSNVNGINKVVIKHIPTAKLENVINQEVTYLLPEIEKAKFANLFSELEDNKAKLGISSFGTSATTMEEVFLKVGESAEHHDDKMAEDCADDDENKNAVEVEESHSLINDSVKVAFSKSRSIDIVDMTKAPAPLSFISGYHKNTGLALALGKMRGIFVKKALNVWRNRIISLTQLLLPVIFTCLALTSNVFKPTVMQEPMLTYDLTPFGSTAIPTTAGLNATPNGVQLQKLYNQQFDSKQSVQSFDISKYDTYDNFTLAQTKSMGIGYFNRHVIIGLEVDNSPYRPIQAISHYNGQPYHAQPIGINYVMNALLQLYLGEDYSIQSGIHPFPMNQEENTKRNAGLDIIFGYYIALLLSFGMAFLTAFFVHYLIKERQVGAKHLQTVSGISPISYWLPTFLCDFIAYMIPILCLLIMFAAYNIPAFAGGMRPLVLLVHFMMYGFAVLPCMYTMQFLFRSPPTGVVVILIFSIFSGIVCLTVLTILKLPSTKLQDLAQTLDYVFMLLFPNYSMAQGLTDIYINYHSTKFCENVVCTPGTQHLCCRETGYFSMDKPGIGLNSLVFFITGTSYFSLVFLIDYNILQKLVYRITAVLGNSNIVNANTGGPVFVDSDVAMEEERIHASSPDDLNKTDSLLLVDLYKKYGTLVAVDHLSLGIPQQECFGLLGQNGAGKTTIFKMLTGDVMATGGNAYLGGHDIVKNIKKVQANMGYCPQFDALIDQMTGRETLTMYARLKGVPEANVKDVVENLIEGLMLDALADKLVDAYSGGNKRKLSTAIALVGMPHFIMLDEPSAGMDPKTRRQLWTVLSQVREAGHTLILTSHSMEECDALCTRIAIMVNGKFMCLGSPQHLKNRFGEGYTLIVQLGLNEDGTWPLTAPIIEYISQYLPGLKVFDDHQGYVHFQVPDATVKLADVFSLMEACKEYFNIQDYSVHQTTLEQVFLTFTKAQNVSANPRKNGFFSCCKS